MNTAETVVAMTEGTLLAGALLAVTREAVKRPWIKFSCSVSFGILPADKRDPKPTSTAAAAAGEAPAAPADPAQQIRPAA